MTSSDLFILRDSVPLYEEGKVDQELVNTLGPESKRLLGFAELLLPPPNFIAIPKSTFEKLNQWIIDNPPPPEAPPPEEAPPGEENPPASAKSTEDAASLQSPKTDSQEEESQAETTTEEADTATIESIEEPPKDTYAQTLAKEIILSLNKIGEKTGFSYGSPTKPILVSFSLDADQNGDQIKGIGLNEEIVQSLVQSGGDPTQLYGILAGFNEKIFQSNRYTTILENPPYIVEEEPPSSEEQPGSGTEQTESTENAETNESNPPAETESGDDHPPEDSSTYTDTEGGDESTGDTEQTSENPPEGEEGEPGPSILETPQEEPEEEKPKKIDWNALFAQFREGGEVIDDLQAQIEKSVLYFYENWKENQENFSNVLISLETFASPESFGYGIIKSRNVETGEAGINGHFQFAISKPDDLQEPDTKEISTLGEDNLNVLRDVSLKLETKFKMIQEVEFEIQLGDIGITQRRNIEITEYNASLRLAVDYAKKKKFNLSRYL